MLHVLSSPSPVPSEIFALISLLVVSLIVLLILRYYLPLRTTPAFYLVPIFFSLWLPACIVLLVPIDLASGAKTDDLESRGIWLPERVLLVSWRITYWLTFALTWFILPILGEYSDAGYREPRDNLIYSLRENAQYHAMVFGVGLLGLIYVFITHGVEIDSLKAPIMALAYCWGLALAIYLMGHGLVSIPRRLFRHASISGRLRRLQSHAPKLHEQMEDSLENLEDVEVQVTELSRRKVGSARMFDDWIEELVEIVNLSESQPRVSALGSAPERGILPTVITEKFMADLTRRLTRARHARSRYSMEWARLVKEAARTQAILDSAASKKLEFGDASPHAGFWDRFTLLNPYTRYLFYYHIQPHGSILLGIFLSMASACIVWSELVKSGEQSFGLSPKLSVIRLTVVHHWVGDRGQVGFAGQVIAACWTLYMCAAALITMTEVKTWRGRALVRRNTAYESAFWYASQVAKLTVPLSYNFMTFLSKEIYTKTRFYAFLGQFINLTSLKWFDYLFPILILLPVCATLFGIYGRVKRLFGFGVDIIDDEEDNLTGYGTGSWREGRDLIERELNGNSINRRRDGPVARLLGAGQPSGRRSAPILSIPAPRNGDSSSSPTRPPVRSSANASRHGHAPRTAYTDQEPEDENFFESLGHRMKNTIDGIEAPKWFQDIKRPKWMGGDDDDDGGANRPSNSRNDSDIRRWFGGEGRIRLG